MKLPLYEEVEYFLYWFHDDSIVFEAIMPYYAYFMYSLLVIALVNNIFYTPLRLLTKKNNKENFWSQYETGGI